MYKASNLINEKIHEIKNKLRVIETTEISNSNKPRQDMQKQINDLDTFLSNKNNRIASNERNVKRSSMRVSEIDCELIKMRETYTTINDNELTFDENDFHCPTCKREFDQEHSGELKADMIKTFNLNKTKKLQELSAKGKSLNAEKAEENGLIDKYVVENEVLVADVARNEIELNTLQTKVENIETYEFIKTDEYLALEKEIAMLEASIKEPNTEYLDTIKADKRDREKEIDSLKAEINQKAQFEKNQIRITELEDRKTELGIQIAELEGQEFLCESFIKAKVDMLEDKINSMFKNVNFRLFETQINEGLKECCDVLVNGVPYADVNTGGKINAGLDVLNTLCDYYKVYAPIFIDGRESITKIIDVKSQVINLKVVEGQKLTIEGVE